MLPESQLGLSGFPLGYPLKAPNNLVDLVLFSHYSILWSTFIKVNAEYEILPAFPSSLATRPVALRFGLLEIYKIHCYRTVA